MTPLLTFSCQRIASSCVRELANKTIALGGDGQRPEPRSEVEPEQRLWKVCKETASLNFGISEWIVFLFFGVVAIAATVYSFSELFHLLGSGSVEHAVEALLTR